MKPSKRPSEGALRNPDSVITEVGGVQQPKQSAQILFFEGPDNHIAHTAPCILLVPCTLWGHDLSLSKGHDLADAFSIQAIDGQQPKPLAWKKSNLLG